MENFALISQSKIEEIINKLDEIQNAIKNGEIKQIEDWIPEKEAQKLLGLKATSLWSLRVRHEIKYSKVGNKTFYSLISIKKYLDKNQK